MNNVFSSAMRGKQREDAIAKTVNTSLLLDAYGSLLAERQRECLTLFYEEDLSLAEIGEIFSISRQAVHDAIRHGEAQLKTYEDTLHVVEKETERQQIVSRLRTLLKNDETAAALLDRLV